MTSTSFRFQHLASHSRAHVSEKSNVDGSLPRLPEALLEGIAFSPLNLSASVLRTMKRGPYEFKGNRYHSRSEAACSTLMQKYVGYDVRDKETLNVPVGVTPEGQVQSVDFRLGEVMIEYHPAIVRKRSWRNADRQTQKEMSQLSSKYRTAKRGDKRELKELIDHKLDQIYFEERRALLNRNPDFADKELIVANSPKAFYEKVIVRFGEPARIPSLEHFLREFESIQSRVKDHSTGGKKRQKATEARVQNRQARRDQRNLERVSRYSQAG